LPDPAAAETSSDWPTVVMPSHCSRVQWP
jgi:hypothetical protein